MTNSNIENQRYRILLQKIFDVPLREALNSVEKEIPVARRELKNRVEQLRDTYKYMLHYFAEGYEDANRRKMVADIREKLARILDTLSIDTRKDEAQGAWWSALRLSELHGRKLSEIAERLRNLETEIGLCIDKTEAPKEIITERDEALVNLFDSVWTNYHFSKNDVEAALEIASGSSGEAAAKVLMAALLAGSLRYYDEEKLRLMISLVNAGFTLASEPEQENEDASKSAEERGIVALTGIILNLIRFNGRIGEDSRLYQELQEWKENDLIRGLMSDVAKELLRTVDTARAAKKMKEDIIPGLMKMRPEILKKMKDLSPEMDVASLEENPEWADMLENSGIRSSLEELSGMQAEGADLMMSAFANLKNFRFFSNPSNWFIPFMPEHHEIIDLSKSEGKDFINLITETKFISESDKYSLALSFSRMPASQRSALIGGISEQFAQANEAKSLQMKLEEEKSSRRYAGAMIRDLYRFDKLFDKKGDAEFDIFGRATDFISSRLLREIIGTDDFNILVAEFFFSRKMYEEALPYLLAAENSGYERIDEKIGYCYQFRKDFRNANLYYQRAMLLSPASRWLTRRLAQVNSHLGNHDEAARYYGELLVENPENRSLLMYRANALYAAGKIKEALQDYYKLSYLDATYEDALRAIAWCEFLLGNNEKSKSTYMQLLLSGPDESDWLNCGHLALAQGNIREAAGYYKESIKAGGFETFDKAFAKDASTLIEHGVTEETIELIRDLILYESEN